MKPKLPALLVLTITSAVLLTSGWWAPTIEADSRPCALVASSVMVRPDLSWTIEVIDSTGWAGRYPSLALDSNGYPHISYCLYDMVKDTCIELKYAYQDSSGWHIAVVESADGVGFFTSLALDASDRPRISYSDKANDDLKYAYFDGTWHTEVVDAAIDVDVAPGTALALDTVGQPHIAYQDSAAYDLKYARFDGSTWITECVDAAGSTGMYPSLVLDGNDAPHISYFTSTGWDLQYAHWTGSAWHIETVDGPDSVGMASSLALDSTGRPHIGYNDFTNSDLKYTYYDGAAWQHQTIDSAGNVGWAISLALDELDRPHISYYDGTNEDLKYAVFDGTTWQTETVDTAGRVGEHGSLALDAAGQPHIAYYAYTGHDLKYAYVCAAPTGVAIYGPGTVLADTLATYEARALGASPPISFTWSNGATGSETQYSWPQTGTYTIAVTATNACGAASGTQSVSVIAFWPYRVYLPLVQRND